MKSETKDRLEEVKAHGKAIRAYLEAWESTGEEKLTAILAAWKQLKATRKPGTKILKASGESGATTLTKKALVPRKRRKG